MECASKGVCFWIGQTDVEIQLSIKKAMHFQQMIEEMEGSYRQKNAEIEDAHTKKLEEAQAEYQKAISSFQTKDSERESLLGDNKELQEKYAEKSRYFVYLTLCHQQFVQSEVSLANNSVVKSQG